MKFCFVFFNMILTVALNRKGRIFYFTCKVTGSVMCFKVCVFFQIGLLSETDKFDSEVARGNSI